MENRIREHIDSIVQEFTGKPFTEELKASIAKKIGDELKRSVKISGNTSIAFDVEKKCFNFTWEPIIEII